MKQHHAPKEGKDKHGEEVHDLAVEHGDHEQKKEKDDDVCDVIVEVSEAGLHAVAPGEWAIAAVEEIRNDEEQGKEGEITLVEEVYAEEATNKGVGGKDIWGVAGSLEEWV